MMRFKTLALAALWSAMPAPVLAQPTDAEFQREVLERLERIEQRLRLLDSGGGAGVGSVEAATEQFCGSSDCTAQATVYCRNAGYANGLPAGIRTEDDGYRVMTRVTCTR